MGDIQGLGVSCAIIQTEQEDKTTQQLSSVLRSFQCPGLGSASSTSKLFNNSPIPIELTGSSSGQKRQVADPDSDEDLLGALNSPTTIPHYALPVIPRPWPVTSVIIDDSIIAGNSRKAIFSLAAADETMVFLNERAAQTFCALLLSL